MNCCGATANVWKKKVVALGVNSVLNIVWLDRASAVFFRPRCGLV